MLRVLRRCPRSISPSSGLLAPSTVAESNQHVRGFRSTAPVERHPIMIGLVGASLALTAHYTLRAHRRLQAQKEAEPFERATMLMGLDIGLSTTRLAGIDTQGASERTIATEPMSVQIRSGEVVVGALAVKNAVPRLRDELSHKRPLTQLGVDADEIDPAFFVDSVLSKLLQRLHTDVGNTLEKDEADVPCVVALPTGFGDAEKDRIRAILAAANMHVLGYVREPIAAVFAASEWDETLRHVAVVDMGGAETQCSILDCSDPRAPEILASKASTAMSGTVLDDAIIDMLARDFLAKTAIDLRSDSLALDRLREAAENAKKELSTAKVSHVNLPFITADSKGAKHLEHALSLSALQRLAAPALDAGRALVADVLADAKLTQQDIDAVVFCGGGMKSKYIQSQVAAFLDHPEVVDTGNEEDAVVRGALEAGRRYWAEMEESR
ncbi:chaperone protein dnak [Achlya hypogyna]|uniref:Chaperone protein dnak n=1 Tax=Achlya hypogyna TaxID=1202772 RepID=A0A1V9Z662_ACHHY|nr:chaperone protein dnak [Achlya hypogyna]